MKYIEYVGGRGRVFKVRDRTGDTYGSLTVLYSYGRNASNQMLWVCRCSCGKVTKVASNNLANGHTKSCGCIQKVGRQTHGMSRHRMYPVWAGMMARCYDKTNKRYASYGGRGVTVCDRWHDVRLFIQDMSPRPRGASIERKDNDRGYSRRNCVWASVQMQANNKRTTIRLTCNGETRPVTEWAKMLGIEAETLRARKRLGWTDEEILTTAVHSRR